jgi:nicotinate-nucleotide adenylyltransferase
VHLGHLIVAEEVMARLGLGEVLFVPAGRPWFKDGQQVTGARHRLAMVRLAVEGEINLHISEAEVARPGPSYTADTLEHLKRERGAETDLYVVVGLDALAEIDRWHRPERVLELCTLVGVARPGSDTLDRSALDSVAAGAGASVILVDGPMIGISSTEIREKVAGGKSVRYLVPPAVETYIHEHGLYGSGHE